MLLRLLCFSLLLQTTPINVRLIEAPETILTYPLRSHAEVVAVAGASNPNVQYDPELDAAVMITREGDRGIPLIHELRLPAQLPRLQDGDVLEVGFSVWLGEEIDDAYRNHIQDNGGTKFFHYRGADRSDGDYRDGLWKTALNIRVGENCQPPCIGRLSAQLAAEHLGANATSNEPVQPASWPDLAVGRWHRVDIRWNIRGPVSEPVSTFSVWVGEHKAIDELMLRPPWSDEHQRGYTYIHFLQSWKENMPFDIRVAVRDVTVRLS